MCKGWFYITISMRLSSFFSIYSVFLKIKVHLSLPCSFAHLFFTLFICSFVHLFFTLQGTFLTKQSVPVCFASFNSVGRVEFQSGA